MRIAQVVPRGEQPWSGVLTVIVHLSAALSRQGHDVEVWQLHEWGPDYAEQRHVMDIAGVRELHAAAGAPWWRVGREVDRLAAERDIDIVHLHGAFNVWNTVISRALRRPYAFSPHSGYAPISLRRSRMRKAVYKLVFERRMLRRAALLVALTELELAQLHDYGTRRPAAVIPNGVATFAGGVNHETFRLDLGIEQDTPLALFVGRLDVHRKGLDRLIDGIARTPEWHLALVGPRFRDVEQLDAMIRALGITDRVHLVGSRQGIRLSEALVAADVFIMLSRWEGLPMALLEALSAGTPAVVSPAVGRLVPIATSGAGWVATKEEIPAVLGRLAAATADDRARWREAARRLAGRYEWDSVAQQYADGYRRAVQAESAAPK